MIFAAGRRIVRLILLGAPYAPFFNKTFANQSTSKKCEFGLDKPVHLSSTVFKIVCSCKLFFTINLLSLRIVLWNMPEYPVACCGDEWHPFKKTVSIGCKTFGCSKSFF